MVGREAGKALGPTSPNKKFVDLLLLSARMLHCIVNWLLHLQMDSSLISGWLHLPLSQACVRSAPQFLGLRCSNYGYAHSVQCDIPGGSVCGCFFLWVWFLV